MNKSRKTDDGVRTYGELIEELAAKQFELYKNIKSSPYMMDLTGGDPRGTALHDLKMKVFVAERAIEKLNWLIDEYEAAIEESEA